MTEIRKGHIHRTVEQLGMGYIADPAHDLIWLFRFSQVNGFRGQDPEDIGLTEGADVAFTLRDGALIEAQISGKSYSKSNAN